MPTTPQTTTCDCQNPDGPAGVRHVSMECPVHNENPQEPPQTTEALIDLEARFVAWDGDPHFGSYIELPTMEGADGVTFFCPFGGEKACSILLWTHDVPASVNPGPGRWTMTGTGMHDLNLTPSVDMSAGPCACKWHGWIKDGVCI